MKTTTKNPGAVQYLLYRKDTIISTRSAAEDLVCARIGSIPPAGNLAARTRLKLWLCGTEVGSALKSRLKSERNAAM